MAKLNLDTEEKNPKKMMGLFILLTCIIILVGLVAMVRLDVFGLGSNLLYEPLKDVPILNLMLPKNQRVEPEETSEDQAYYFETVEEALLIIKERDTTIKELQEEAERISEAYYRLSEENKALKVYEANQLQFQLDKAALDELIADHADPSAYMQYVERTYQDHALAIYQRFVQEAVYEEAVMDNVKIFAAMKAKDAAAILEITHLTDMPMVAEILSLVTPAQAGSILSSMDPTVADRISRYMYPEEN